MARSSHGSRRALPWATTQNSRPAPRMVRLGRAANDNGRLPRWQVRLLVLSVIVALSAMAIADWLL